MIGKFKLKFSLRSLCLLSCLLTISLLSGCGKPQNKKENPAPVSELDTKDDKRQTEREKKQAAEATGMEKRDAAENEERTLELEKTRKRNFRRLSPNS